MQADVDLAAADDPLALVEGHLAHPRQQVLELLVPEIGEERQTRDTLDEGRSVAIARNLNHLVGLGGKVAT